MPVITRISGIHPRSEEHIRVSRRHDRREASQEELESAREKDTKSFISLQDSLGISLISDGCLGWQDIFRRVCESCDGVSIGALTRWFDTNTFFRQPVITSEMRLRNWKENPLLPKEKGLAILPGCYTFAMLAKDSHYGGFSELIHAIADVLASITKSYLSIGVEHILFTEPSLVVTPPKKDTWSPVVECYRKIKSLGARDIIIQTFFGDMRNALPSILELPATALGVDFFETEIDSLSGCDLGKLRIDCGCIDATNSFVETPGDVVKFVETARTKLNLMRIGITPNAPMEYLPRLTADQKLRVIADASRMIRGD